MEIILKDETSGRQHRFTQRSITLGRVPTCDLMIISRQVSRVHLELRLERNRCWLIAGAASNGTFVNGTLVEAGKHWPLNVGDQIRLGRTGPVLTLVTFNLQVPTTGHLPSLEQLAETHYDVDTGALAPPAAPSYEYRAEAATDEACLVAGGALCRSCGIFAKPGQAFCPVCGTALIDREDKQKARQTDDMAATMTGLAPETMMAPPVANRPAPPQSTMMSAPPPTMMSAPPPAPQIAVPYVDYASTPAIGESLPQPTSSPAPVPTAARSSRSWLGRLWHSVFGGNGAERPVKSAPVKELSKTAPAPPQVAPPLVPETVAAINDAVRVAGPASADVTAPADVVDCTIYAPPSAERGMTLLIQVFAHLAQDANVVRALAQRFDAQAQERGFQGLEVEIARGAKLDFHLTMPGLEVEYPVYSLVWRGKPNSVQFGVRVPRDCDLGTYLGTVIVSLQGLPVGHIKFKLDVTADTARAQTPPAPALTGQGRAYRRAFVSFARADRNEAAKRMQMLAALRIEVPPLNWEGERELLSHALIDDSDLFLLCWSDAAQHSRRVRQELDYALERQNSHAQAWPEILPVLMTHPAPAPPPALSGLSFDDFTPYWERITTAPTQPSHTLGLATLPAAETDVRGQLVKNRYQIGALLGRGGFGTAYRAADLTLAQRPVVVKVLHAECLRNAWLVHKFQHEIEALARLHHNGIVSIFDAGQLPDERPFLVLEYIEGQTLRAALQPAQPQGLPLREAANIIAQTGAALAAAHEKGVLHRDIKPENIMLQPLNDGGTQVKLIDFGIAKVRDAVLAPTTEGARVAGTYLYMSPEQLLGDELDAASDIYALGLVAYELTTGRLPFQIDNLGQLLAAHQQPVTPPHTLRPDLPVAASDVVLRALSYKPAGRYQNAGDFGQALASALN